MKIILSLASLCGLYAAFGGNLYHAFIAYWSVVGIIFVFDDKKEKKQ